MGSATWGVWATFVCPVNSLVDCPTARCYCCKVLILFVAGLSALLVRRDGSSSDKAGAKTAEQAAEWGWNFPELHATRVRDDWTAAPPEAEADFSTP